MKKLTVNQKEFEKQVKRLTRYVRVYENKGLVFINPIIPERPKRVTKQRIETLRRIKPKDIAKKAYEVDKTTGLVTPYLEPDARKARRTSKAEFPTGGKIAEPKVKLSEEEKHKRRVEGAKKAAETRRQHELADPIFKARMDEVRRKNLEKARYALEQKRLKKGFEEIFEKPYGDIPIEKLNSQPEKSTSDELKELTKSLNENEIPLDEQTEILSTFDPPLRGETMVYQLEAICNGAQNKSTAAFLLDTLEAARLTDEQALYERLANAYELTLDRAQRACWDSNAEVIIQSATAVVEVIQGYVSSSDREAVENVAIGDTPYSTRKRWRAF